MTNPYGTWSSPITPESVVEGERGLGEVAVVGDSVWWAQSDPSDGGRISLWRHDPGADPREVTSEHYVRTAVHEYGGGAWAVGAGDEPVVVFSSWPDHRLWRITGDREPQPITPPVVEGRPPRYRYADLRVHHGRDLVLAVREDHGVDGEPVNTIVALRLSADNPDGGDVLCSGADFYASPELSVSGQLAWIEWDHPAMPWDQTRLMLARLDDRSTGLSGVSTLLAEEDVSVLYPRWHENALGHQDGLRHDDFSTSEQLLVSSDQGGWWQLWQVEGPGSALRLWDGEHDVCGPMWTLGAKPYAITSRGVLGAWHVDGRQRLGLIRTQPGIPTELVHSIDTVAAISADGDRVAMVIGHADRPAEVVRARLDRLPEWEVITRSSDRIPDPAWISVPESVWWDSDLGPVQGWYYPPVNPDVATPEEELPPMIIKSHGGPTSQSRPLYAASVQYWTSRGYACLDVNYGGSSGFGRAYRERLKGRWGEVDVADCISGAVAMTERGLADPARLVITGGSAGGFTTLAALTSSDKFAAGVSLYGVADLSALARDTHKFESRYLDGLVGPWPEAEQIYTARSPINHVDRLSSPMLLLQGTEDKVVPPAQSEMIAEAVRAKRLPVALVMYEGESHGFRRAETVIHYLQSMEVFCARVLGFVPAGELPALTIENLADA